MNKQKVYRAGSMTPSPDAGAAHAVTALADQFCPHPASRMGSLFAAPALDGVVRWVLGNHMCRYETRVREITVDADTTYVYRVDAWENVSWNMRGFEESKARAYWDGGMTLTQWLERAEAEGLDASEWEVLVRPENVLAVRNVSAKRILDAAPDWREPELKRVVRDWRHAA